MQMVMGRWSEFNVMTVDQLKFNAMDEEAKETSGEEFEDSRVAMLGLFRATKLLLSNSSAIAPPQGSAFLSDHKSLCPLTSPTRELATRRGEKFGAKIWRARRLRRNVDVSDEDIHSGDVSSVEPSLIRDCILANLME